MGGRGSSGSGNAMNVPYDKWGKEVFEYLYNKDGDVIGQIEDETRYTSEEDIRPATKKDVLDDINAWRNDDGTYGDEDTKMYIAYKDGSVVDLDDLDGKAYKKSNIVGASISTGDYEMVWGGEIDRNGKFREWQTWSEDGESGQPNSYSGYKTVGAYKVRVKTTYNNPNGRGGYKTKREIIRKSKVKPVGDRL